MILKQKSIGNRILHLACQHGSLDLVKHLVEVAGCDINAKGQYEKDCLHFACLNQRSGTKIVQFLFSKQDWCVEAAGKNNNRPIHLACQHGSVDLVKHLVEVAGCDINAKGQNEKSCLHFAFLNSWHKWEIIKFLTSRPNCDIETKVNDGNRILHLACQHGSLDLVKHLVEVAGCDINAKGQYEKDCLHFACLNQCSGTKIVQFLFSKQDWYVEAADKNNNRPIHLACQHGSVDLVKHLVEVAGCDINAKSQHEKSCLHFAFLNSWHKWEIIKFLTSRPNCDIETKVNDGNRILHLACQHGSLDLVKHLVEVAGCDINAKGQYEKDCLHFACLNQCSGTKIVQFLFSKQDWCVEAADKNGNRPTHLACQHGSVDLVKHLVEVAGCDINAKGQYEKDCLHFACLNQCSGTKIVQFLFSKQDWYVEAADKNGNRPTHLACEHGSVDLVKHLVEVAGCDINAKGQHEKSCLHFAFLNSWHKWEIIKFLTSRPNCDIETKVNDGNRILHLACQHGSLDLVKHLVEVAGCDINAKGQHEKSCLHFACLNQCSGTKIVQFLFSKQDWYVEAADKNGNRPIHLACEHGSVDLVKHLVEVAGCDINARGKNKMTCLHYACNRNYYDMIKLISDQPQCDLEAKDGDCKEAFNFSFNNYNTCICKHLIIEIAYRKRSGNDLIDLMKIINVITAQNSSNIGDENDHDQSSSYMETESILSHQLLLLATLHGNVENVKSLLSRGDYDVNTKGHGGYTLLHCACASNNLACVEFLTSQINCDVEVQNDDHDRPLHIASCFGSVDITRHLVEIAGCDINSKGNHGYSPLHYACNRSHLEVVQFLTAQTHCDVEVEDDNCDRPLHIASYIGTMNIVMHLVNVIGCDINAKGSNGYTSLHHACEKGYFEVVSFLTMQSKFTVHVNEQNNDNEQPLHIAARVGSIDIVKYLAEKASCDVNAKGQNDYTPLHYACKHSSIEVMEYLLDHPNFDTDVLFLLDDYEDKLVQTVINFHKKFQQAIRSTGVAYLRVVKCILTGPPGAGKSTLKKRLLNESLIEPSLSTGVADAAVLVNSFCKSQGAIVPSLQKVTEHSFREVQQDTAIIRPKTTEPEKYSTYEMEQDAATEPFLQNATEWNRQNIEEEATFILETLSNVNPTTQKYKTSSYQMSSSLTAFFSAHESYDDHVTKHLSVDDENSMDCETVVTDHVNNDKHAQRSESTDTVMLDSSKAKAVKMLLEIVQMNPVTKNREYKQKTGQMFSPDNHAMLHIIDTGGQPEFHEILPALITGPAINLLVFKLTEDLRSRYYITYRSPTTGESQPYETSLTHEEVIFCSLASIACLRQNTIGWSFKESPIDDDSESAAFLIATHRDQVSHSKVTEVNEQLKANIQNSDLFHENLVQFATPDLLIYPIDTKTDQKEIEDMRNMLHKVISNKFHNFPIPLSWCALSVKLKKARSSLHNIDSCYELALECGITDKDDFMFALWFLHHRVGSIMYYPEVNGLKDIVITDLQLVFDHITHLITSCFTFKSSGNAASDNEFRKTGRFTEENIIKLSKKSDDPLSPVILVSLLKHLYIVAGPMSIKSGSKSDSYYFMPCALKPAAVEEEQRDASLSPAPLLIYFECGYCPVGVFPCLVVHLLSTELSKLKWTLDEAPHFRNKVTFLVGKCYHCITLISRATYLEVWPDSTVRMGSTLPFFEIYQTLNKALELVTQSLHYTYKSDHFFGFPCTTCQSSPPHPAICEYDDDSLAAKCVQGGEPISLQIKHTVWLKVFAVNIE